MKINELVDLRASYSEVHVLKALMLLAEMPHGRFLLMKKLQLNEASARTLLSKLEQKNYSRPSPYGHALTKKGNVFVKKIRQRIIGPIKVGKTLVTLSDSNVAYIVRNASNKIKSGVEQRDTAIKLGANGLTTLVQENKKLSFPLSNKKVPESVQKLFSLKENDVVLIGSSDNEITADLSALYAAYSISFK